MQAKKCVNCTGELTFSPGTESMKCPYCGAENELIVEKAVQTELDFHEYLQKAAADSAQEESFTVDCPSCTARFTTEQNQTSASCPFCGTGIDVSGKSTRELKPSYLLPFAIERRNGEEKFREWIKKRWFAPNNLKRLANNRDLKGVYTPYWTYDSDTTTYYRGRRGEYYYVTETYTATENGESVQKTRQVRKTRWYPASGYVNNSFDDVLVVASTSLPEKLADGLAPWDLENMVKYSNDFTQGFQTESYSVDLEQGFERAGEKMEPEIRQTIKHDIGGDEQQITAMDVSYKDISFKHMLLPIWISSYQYRDKIYRFLINARNGKVMGERPWSWIKITLAVLGGLAIAGGIAFLFYAIDQGWIG